MRLWYRQLEPRLTIVNSTSTTTTTRNKSKINARTRSKSTGIWDEHRVEKKIRCLALESSLLRTASVPRRIHECNTMNRGRQIESRRFAERSPIVDLSFGLRARWMNACVRMCGKNVREHVRMSVTGKERE